MTDPVAVVRSLVARINGSDWAGVHALLHANFRRHSMAAGGRGEETAEEFVCFLQEEHVAYPDAHEVLLDAFAAGAQVAARHQFTGTQLGPLGAHPPTGRTVRSTYLAIYRIEDGRIREAWAEWDNLADLRQLGHLPEAG
ncbi:MAG: ester cyclase [Proteobacteria bacterium]|nr:ester cyclase [Pseudomonadota bacterium]